MEFNEIKQYLMNFDGSQLKPNILNSLSSLKKRAVSENNQILAKEIWCIEQVYKVLNHYLGAYKDMKNNDFYNAWNELDRADIELFFLRKHFNYTNNQYRLDSIEKNIYQLQKLFPYKHFFSRESIVKKWKFSICNKTISVRKSCSHRIGEIYNGEQCVRIAQDFEFIGVAIVTDPFDKYTVVFPEDLEYNYAMLENLMKYLSHPFEKWELEISKETLPQFKNLGRNHSCLCQSGKKYKNCCLKSGEDLFDHYQMNFLEKSSKGIPTEPIQLINTWKN
ncbi:SEC-C metal-binding domain-containing protein [Bacillus sp. SM2101]|uniref:YecA family protein n=1 Tax=Bacillus sp. SM2101 TaxID=2805366 RepID=UPI001BDED4A0|nr:SEC-C metal-binding domain-containing protein [Bacillus sp. SM2101]